jgi:hypothetical protein
VPAAPETLPPILEVVVLKIQLTGKMKDGRLVHLVVLGLSRTNLARLKKGQPIRFDAAEVGLPDVEVLIFAGETEQSMAREIADLIGPETEVRIDPRLRD